MQGCWESSSSICNAHVVGVRLPEAGKPHALSPHTQQQCWWGGLSGVGTLVGLGQTAASSQRKMLPSPGTKIKSEGICDSSNFYIVCRDLNSSREWIQPNNAWLGDHQWRSALSPALRWSSPQKWKLLAACIDLIPCIERDKQFQNAEGVCETTNDGGVQGTSTSFGILSHYSSFYTRLNFNVLWKMDGT